VHFFSPANQLIDAFFSEFEAGDLLEGHHLTSVHDLGLNLLYQGFIAVF
jgi:hypothetical protein